MEERQVIVEPGPAGTIPLSHTGAMALYGDSAQPDLRHRLGGEVIHGSDPGRPLMHMICWDTEPCQVSVRGEVALVGDPDRAIRHEIVGEHRQLLRVEELDHSVRMETELAKPIHHALQMRTPVQLRFCNPWHVASDYRFDIHLWDSRVISVRLTGATVATPQPCEADDCPPGDPGPLHP
jgi:hypothetical protein